MIRIFVISLILCFGAFIAHGQEIKGLDVSPLDFAVFRPNGPLTTPVARIIYSRPHKKGRTVFGELVPYGKLWRTGANQTTELNLYQDITIQGQKLTAGYYTLYTIPEEQEWTVVINSKLFTWGDYDYDDSKDVMRFKVTALQASEERESFGIAFGGEKGNGRILLGWDKTEVLIDFEY